MDLLGGDLFGGPSSGPAATGLIKPTSVWMEAAAGNGLEISGTCARKAGHCYLDMSFANKGAVPLSVRQLRHLLLLTFLDLGHSHAGSRLCTTTHAPYGGICPTWCPCLPDADWRLQYPMG